MMEGAIVMLAHACDGKIPAMEAVGEKTVDSSLQFWDPVVESTKATYVAKLESGHRAFEAIIAHPKT